MSKTKLGKAAEDLAVQFLTAKGYVVVARNYKPHRWEIDIIAQQGPTLVFVEVKSRADTTFGFPEVAVGAQKRAYIHRTAELYLEQHNYHGDIRFDIVSIVTGPEPEITHFEDAF